MSATPIALAEVEEQEVAVQIARGEGHMRRPVILLVGALIHVLLAGCMTTGQSRIYSELYSIDQSEIEVLEGTYTAQELLVYKDAAVGDTMSISLLTTTAEDFAPMFVLRIDGSDWLFPERLGVELNSTIVRLEAAEERTEVISGTWVSETYWYEIPDGALTELTELESLRFEVPSKGVIEIPEEGIEVIGDFMSDAS